MIAHVSVFDPLDDGELAELKAHAADWVAEAAHADQSRSSLASWRLSGEFHDLFTELRRELRLRQARRAAA
jgi:hypothetical protein